MKKAKRMGIVILAALIVCAACFFVGKSIGSAPENREMSAVVLENKLTEISELASMTYSYTNMAEFESSKDFYGMKLPFTTKSFIITYDGEIKAGVDMADAKVTVRGHKVSVTLPDAKILSHEIDEDSIEVFDESVSIFNPLKVDDFKAFSKDQKSEMEKKAVDKGLLTNARTKAASSIKALLTQALDKEYTIEIK